MSNPKMFRQSKSVCTTTVEQRLITRMNGKMAAKLNVRPGSSARDIQWSAALFRRFAFFTADSDNMKNISVNHCFFRGFEL